MKRIFHSWLNVLQTPKMRDLGFDSLSIRERSENDTRKPQNNVNSKIQRENRFTNVPDSQVNARIQPFQQLIEYI